MAKQTTIFYCKECGTEVSKWQGQCPGCHAWNTLVEAPAQPAAAPGRTAARTGRAAVQAARPSLLSEIETEQQVRYSTHMKELDRVLGGGLVPGSLLLVGGDPGIGKSTLLLQVCRELGQDGHEVLYISGEESLRQIRLRADRIGAFSDHVRFLCETDLDRIAGVMEEQKPDFAVIDSIQTMYREDVAAAPGSVSQVRESTQVLLQLAKGLGVTIFIVGHVTKEGAVAGPRMLEHMVDAVLYFEGDSQASYRILRGVKNRFGSTNEIGVFEMRETGLAEVANPSEYMLSGRPQGSSGSVVACAIEGTRPLLLEVQALVCRSNFGMPRRTAAGTDYNRVNLLMAVLEKRAGLRLSELDAYVNVAGGMRISEPALDLAICLAIASSAKDAAIDEKTIAFGEVGLSGEVRAVSQAAQRVAEARKLGFTRVILPQVSVKGARAAAGDGVELVGVKNVREALAVM